MVEGNQEAIYMGNSEVEDLAIRTISQPNMEGAKAVGRYFIYSLRHDSFHMTIEAKVIQKMDKAIKATVFEDESSYHYHIIYLPEKLWQTI